MRIQSNLPLLAAILALMGAVGAVHHLTHHGYRSTDTTGEKSGSNIATEKKGGLASFHSALRAVERNGNRKDLETLFDGALHYELEQPSVDAIEGAVEGQGLAIGALPGRVMMVSDTGSDCWLTAVELNDFEGAVLSVALEPDGQIHARIFSTDSEAAWYGVAAADAPLVLQQVPSTELVPVCASPPTDGGGVAMGGATGMVPLRESLPGAKNVLYLDFDGEEVSGTVWNANYTNGDSIEAAASGLDTDEMERIWKEVSEDYRPFEVNVSTNRAVYDATPVGDRMMAVFTPRDGWYNDRQPDYAKDGGAAGLGTFGSAAQPVCWVFTNRVGGASNRAVACSHELGHTMGLHHDGATTKEYYEGHGEGATSWGPIMGNPYGRRVTQWNAGDYEGYLNLDGGSEDDIAVISERLGVRQDEDRNDPGSARDLKASSSPDGTGVVLTGDGVIGNRFDTDFFRYQAKVPGVLAVSVEPYSSTSERDGANLDLEVQLLNSSGTTLAAANPSDELGTVLSYQVETPGTYYVRIDGTEKATRDGYSDYGSVGCYLVEGSFTFSTAVEIVRQPVGIRATEGAEARLSVVASGSNLTYQWQRKVRGGPWANFGEITTDPELVIISVQLQDAGDYRVVVGSANGSITSEVARLLVDAIQLQGASYQWTNFVGKPGGAGSDDGVGSDAHFNFPYDVASGNRGDIFVADTGNNTIRKVSPSGIVTTVAGAPGEGGSADGFGSDARFNSPRGIAVDEFDNIYVADSGNNTIRVVNAVGNVVTIAGHPGLQGVKDGHGSEARFNRPTGLTVDRFGIVYVTDSSNHTIRVVDPNGWVTTLAGSPGGNGVTDGIGSDARFWSPEGLTVDENGNLYVADSWNDTIRRVSPDGNVTTVAGKPGERGTVNGTGSEAKFWHPVGMAVDSKGIVYIAQDFGIRRLDQSGAVTFFAGGGGLGGTDGKGADAAFFEPKGMTLDGMGNLYIADSENHSIRKVSPDGNVTTLAGQAKMRGNADGLGTNARFRSPEGLAIGRFDNIFVADSENHSIRRVSPSGVVTTIAGGAVGSADGSGLNAEFNLPKDLGVNEMGGLFVADSWNNTIRTVNPQGLVTTLGTFGRPGVVGVDRAGSFYVDSGGALHKWADGASTPLAGRHGESGSRDGMGDEARFWHIQALTVDVTGNVFVADNNTIRRVSSEGLVTTLAGSPGNRGSADGAGSEARFGWPLAGLATDRSGYVFVADTGNHTIRRVSPEGMVSTIGGSPNKIGQRDGLGSSAMFSSPRGIVISSQGLIYVSESGSDRIRVGRPIFSRVRNAPSTLATESTDTDRDGMSDFDELLVGTDPESASSVLRVLSANILGSGAGQTAEVHFPVVPGRIYRIEYSPNGREASWVAVADLLTPKSGASVMSSKFPVSERESGYVRVAAHVGDAEDSAFSAAFSLNGGQSDPKLVDAFWSADRTSFVLRWTGEQGASYYLERSENLSLWTRVEGSDVAGTGETQDSAVPVHSETTYLRIARSKN